MGLLDQYQIPADLPDMNVGVDPAAMERLKYMALARMGMGMAGREPLGSAMSAGINTMTTGQEQARAEARANMELALKQHQAKQQQLIDLRRAALIKSVPDEQLRAYGVPDPLILGFKTAEKPEQYLAALEQLKSYTISQGQVRFNAAGGPQTQLPDTAGNVTQFDQNGQPSGRMLLPGAAESTATQKYAEARGDTLGKASGTLTQVPLQPGEPGYVPGATKPSLLSTEIAAVQGGGYPDPMKTVGTAASATPTNPRVPLDNSNRLQILQVELKKEQDAGNLTNIAALQKEIAGLQGRPATGATARITNPLAVKQAEQDISTGAGIAQSTHTQLQKDAVGYRDTPDALMQIYRAQDALNSPDAFNGGAGWKAGGVNLLNAVLPEGMRFNVKASAEGAELQKALGAQLIDNARAFGANPTAAEERRLDQIIGSANDPREALQKALPYAEQIIRRSATAHNDRVSQFESKYPVPVDLRAKLPSREEILKQVTSQPTAIAAGQPNATVTAFPKGPPVGTRVMGKTFLGGNPNDQASWK